VAGVAAAVLLALGLGFSNLGVPSLWHDELVHVFVAQHILETGWPALPSGLVYPQASLFNYLLAMVMGMFGDGEAAVRGLSVVASAGTLIVFYLLGRKLVGRNLALVALFLLALSPWHVAWARQARFYELQALGYGVFLLGAWWALGADEKRGRVWGAALLVAGYLVGVLCSFHAVLFLGPVFGHAALRGWFVKKDRRWAWTVAGGTALLGVLTLAVIYLNPNEADQAATLGTGIGGDLMDPKRMVRQYYLTWLRENHSTGYLLLAVLGSLYVVGRFGWRGVFVVLAFWGPVLALTYGIGYRRPRFMYFAFPVYLLLAAGGVGLVWQGLLAWRRSWWYVPVSVFAFVLLARILVSFVGLGADSVEAGMGSHETLARRHPEWRAPATWVKDALREDDAVLTTTWLPVLYYTGRVDNWFPNRYVPWEKDESGVEGLGSLEDLQAFLEAHPSGYFLAESWRFAYWRHHGHVGEELGQEVDWVRENMTVLPRVSSRNVTVYAWGDAARRAAEAGR
jgi:4-amino-4-deoxy-L-arabinose transferase-like glycosyltransferase